MGRRLALLVCGWLALGAGPASAQAYKWVDENGKTHFSDTPPPDRKASALKIRPSAAADPQAAARRPDWQAQLQESNERRLKEQEQQEAAAQKRQVDERNCGVARGELATLQRGRVFRYGSNGEKQYLDDKDRPAALQAAQANVDKYCR